jgi:hypothetical protein
MFKTWQDMILNSFGYDSASEDTAEEKGHVAKLKKKLMAENPHMSPDEALSMAISYLKANGTINRHYGNEPRK